MEPDGTRDDPFWRGPGSSHGDRPRPRCSERRGRSIAKEARVRALVIDDSRAMRTILSRMLVSIGFEVVEASDGRDALAKLDAEGRFDLALVDWNMPNMNGYEFVRAVRAESSRDSMQLMMVTTETETDQVVRALEAGANEYVMKPFTRDVILEKLDILGLQAS
jgi:two-component system chemotaxis response regulator CheY